MMIGILDPALLLPRPGEEDRLEAEIDVINRICRSGQIMLPKLEEYWPALWQELGSSLQRTLTRPRARLALDELRGFGCLPKSIPALEAPPRGRMLGARHMFEIEQLSPTWLDRMTLVLARASASGAPAVLLTRRMVGRNLHIHQVENSRIEEVTRWVTRSARTVSVSPVSLAMEVLPYSPGGGPPEESATLAVVESGSGSTEVPLALALPFALALALPSALAASSALVRTKPVVPSAPLVWLPSPPPSPSNAGLARVHAAELTTTKTRTSRSSWR